MKTIKTLKSENKELLKYARKIVRHFERSGIIGPLTIEGRKLLKMKRK